MHNKTRMKWGMADPLLSGNTICSIPLLFFSQRNHSEKRTRSQKGSLMKRQRVESSVLLSELIRLIGRHQAVAELRSKKLSASQMREVVTRLPIYRRVGLGW